MYTKLMYAVTYLITHFASKFPGLFAAFEPIALSFEVTLGARGHTAGGSDSFIGFICRKEDGAAGMAKSFTLVGFDSMLGLGLSVPS